jgi:hypothetical protein
LGDLWLQYNSHHRRGLDPFANLFRFKGCDEKALQQHKREDIEGIKDIDNYNWVNAQLRQYWRRAGSSNWTVPMRTIN